MLKSEGVLKPIFTWNLDVFYMPRSCYDQWGQEDIYFP